MEKHICLMEQNNLCYRQECLAHCFSLRIELHFERNTAHHSGLSRMRNITIVLNNSTEVNGRSTVFLGRKSPMLERGGTSILFPCENCVSLWKVYLLSECFEGVNHSLYGKSPLQMKWRNTFNKCVSYKITQSVLESRVSSTFFPYDNWVTFGKEYCLPLRVFWNEEHHLCEKYLHSSKWKMHCISLKKTIYVRTRRV
jgi:hypothetical protein